MIADSRMSRPSHTLLLVTPRCVARMDFVGFRKMRLQAAWSHPVSESDESPEPPFGGQSLVVAVAKALNLGPRRTGRVSVVSSHFWTEILHLRSDVVAIASPQEVCQALAIEAEFESGLSAIDSHVAHHPVPSDDPHTFRYCTTQISASQVNGLSQFVRSRGTVLHRLAHPIAFSITDQEVAAEALDIEIRAWRDGSLANHPNPWLSTEPQLVELADDCGKLLGNRSVPSLWIQPKQCIPPRTLVAMSSALAMATALGCAVWNYHDRSTVATRALTLQQLEEQQSRFSETTQEIKRAEARLVKLRKDAQATDKSRQATEHRMRMATVLQQQNNARWGRLLDALAANSDDCWIRRIESNPNNTTLFGVAQDSVQAHSFAARLENALQGSGWMVEPAITCQVLSELSEFSISLLLEVSNVETSESCEAIVLKQMASYPLIHSVAVNTEGPP